MEYKASKLTVEVGKSSHQSVDKINRQNKNWQGRPDLQIIDNWIAC